jgi:hypothetical protein
MGIRPESALNHHRRHGGTEKTCIRNEKNQFSLFAVSR